MYGSTKIYGCIADPIHHVKAPTLFTSIFKEKKIDAVMIPIHVNKNNLENVINSLKVMKNFEGMTVTIPHKILVASLCDHLEPDAKFTQSVNWIKFDNERRLIGNNFDGQGFVTGFKSQNLLLKDKNVCLFGAGGAVLWANFGEKHKPGNAVYTSHFTAVTLTDFSISGWLRKRPTWRH